MNACIFLSVQFLLFSSQNISQSEYLDIKTLWICWTERFSRKKLSPIWISVISTIISVGISIESIIVICSLSFWGRCRCSFSFAQNVWNSRKGGKFTTMDRCLSNRCLFQYISIGEETKTGNLRIVRILGQTESPLFKKPHYLRTKGFWLIFAQIYLKCNDFFQKRHSIWDLDN